MKSTEKKQPAHNQAKSNAKLGMLWQLEPRIMFDGAAAITVIDTINQIHHYWNESVGIKSLFWMRLNFRMMTQIARIPIKMS
ncbi:MAG: hypothetical protein IPJ05_00175 [Nitrosomonas sp.]|nr:hypothetical protein [Nitrosomonas sp.]